MLTRIVYIVGERQRPPEWGMRSLDRRLCVLALWPPSDRYHKAFSGEREETSQSGRKKVRPYADSIAERMASGT